MRRSTLLIAFTFLLFCHIKAQINRQTVIDSVQTQSEVPSVYIDCNRCDFNYIRTEITFVNYVRDPEQADIHVFVTDVATVGGSREYQFSFIGRNAFKGTEYTLNHHIDHNATSDEIRISLTEYLKLGLTSFVLQTPLASKFKINYEEGTKKRSAKENVDPWDYWVFQAYIGRVQFNMESKQSKFDSRWGIYADRVTENWKIRVRPYFNYDRVRMKLPIETSRLLVSSVDMG